MGVRRLEVAAKGATITWSDLAKRLGRWVHDLPNTGRQELLVEVDRPRVPDHPLLSVLVVTHMGRPLWYLGQVLSRLGAAEPTSEFALQQWAAAETRKTHEAYGHRRARASVAPPSAAKRPAAGERAPFGSDVDQAHPRCTAGWEGTPVLSVVNNDGTTETGSLMDDIVREGPRRMLAAALEAEVNQYIAELAGERDEAGRRLVVRNGHHRERTVTTAAGPVAVKAPRVNDKRIDVETGERKRFSSKILAPWCRKSPKISEVLPLLYLHGLSSGDFVPAMEQFLGSSVGLSPATVTRLTKQWTDDHTAFQARDLSDSDYVYVWADGVHPKVRLGQAHSCVLVLMGVRPRRPQGTRRAGRGAA